MSRANQGINNLAMLIRADLRHQPAERQRNLGRARLVLGALLLWELGIIASLLAERLGVPPNRSNLVLILVVLSPFFVALLACISRRGAADCRTVVEAVFGYRGAA